MPIFNMHTEAEWRRILETMQKKTSLAMSLTDPEGKILLSVGTRNPLCTRIRENSETLTYICSQTNTAMTMQVKATKDIVVEYCEAGMIRAAIPIIVKDQIIGQITGCGLIGDPDEIDAYYLAQTLDATEDQVQKMLGDAERNPEFSAEAFKELFVELV